MVVKLAMRRLESSRSGREDWVEVTGEMENRASFERQRADEEKLARNKMEWRACSFVV